MSAKAFNEIRKRTGGKSGRAETSRLVRASIDSGKQKHGNDGGSSFLELFSQAASHLFLKKWLFSPQWQAILQQIRQYVWPLLQVSDLVVLQLTECWVTTCPCQLKHTVIMAQLVSCCFLSSLSLSESSLSMKQTKQQHLFIQDCTLCRGNLVRVSFLLWTLMSSGGRGQNHSEAGTVASWLAVGTAEQYKRNLNQLESSYKGIFQMKWTTHYRRESRFDLKDMTVILLFSPKKTKQPMLSL